MRFLRTLSGVTLRDRIKSEEIRNKWSVEEIIDDIQNDQLKWNQHVLRMPKNILPRKALQYRPPKEKGIQEDLAVVAKTSSCSCRKGIDYLKLRMEEEGGGGEEAKFSCDVKPYNNLSTSFFSLKERSDVCEDLSFLQVIIKYLLQRSNIKLFTDQALKWLNCNY